RRVPAGAGLRVGASRQLWAHRVVGGVRHDVLHLDRHARGPRRGRGHVGRGHRVARRPRTVRRRAHGRGARVRDPLALRRRAAARPVRGGIPRMRVAALAVLLLTPAPALACATCISTPFGDQSSTWPYLGLILLPFGLIGAIAGILGYLSLK